jgi:pilus assembly protein Flp/PilA
MTKIFKLISKLGKDQEGAALVEYGLLIGLIAAVCIAAVTLLGTNVSTMLNSVAGLF